MTAASIDLRQLRYCLAAVDLGSFRKAAIRLGVRESTVSRRIRDLEGLLGVALFTRHPGGVCPTEAGQRFGRHARDILRALGTAVEEAATDGEERARDGRIDAAYMGTLIGAACLVCWRADCHSVSPGDARALLSRTGSDEMREARRTKDAPLPPRSDRAVALGEALFRLVEMLGSAP